MLDNYQKSSLSTCFCKVGKAGLFSFNPKMDLWDYRCDSVFVWFLTRADLFILIQLSFPFCS